MPKSFPQVYSHYTQDALQLLGDLIKIARKEQKLSAQEVAERAGVSRGLIQRIEKNDPKCAIGTVFEVATIVGVQLFSMPNRELRKHIQQSEDKLALLPKAIRKKERPLDDNF